MKVPYWISCGVFVSLRFNIAIGSVSDGCLTPSRSGRRWESSFFMTALSRPLIIKSFSRVEVPTSDAIPKALQWRWEMQRGALVAFVENKDDVTLALKHEWLPRF